MTTTADVLIVGSGAAGLTAALNLAETHKVAVIAKGALGEGATGRGVAPAGVPGCWPPTVGAADGQPAAAGDTGL